MPAIKEALGLMDARDVFSQHWEKHGFPRVTKQGDGPLTKTVQEMFKNPDNRIDHFFEKRLRKKLNKAAGLETKNVIDSSVMEDSIPIIFDPEILTILRETDPILDRLPHEGYEGFKVVCNRIDKFGDPLGMANESSVIDLSSEDGNAYTIEKVEEDMKIYHDVASISDFTQRASEHYTNVRDTALGMSVAAHANFKAAQVLYGKPDAADDEGSVTEIDDGSIFSKHAYEGLAEKLSYTDKSTVDLDSDQALLKDIKSEIKDLLQQGYNITKNDLEIWTSHDVHDFLENEMGPKYRVSVDDQTFDFGFEGIHISGVPVIPSHNVKEHETEIRNDADDGDVTFKTGDEGDVFIVNTRSTRFRSLAPLSTVPLARVGLADRVALYEYGVLVERSNGSWGKYLGEYDI